MSADGMVFDFGSTMYIIGAQVSCSIGGKNSPCYTIGNGSLFVSLSGFQNQKLSVAISGVYNFIFLNALQIRTVALISGTTSSGKVSSSSASYSDVDLFYSAGLSISAFSVADLPFRAIVPNNYMQGTVLVSVLIVIDRVFPSNTPLNALKVGLSIPSLSC